MLDEVCYKPDESVFSDAQQPFNLAKNRYPTILPCKICYQYDVPIVSSLSLVNGFRPRLKTDGDTPDYINASLVDVSY